MSRRRWTLLIAAIPFFVYAAVLGRYLINVPVWDDYIGLLQSLNRAIEAPSVSEKITLLAEPINHYHIPLVTRSLMYGVYATGGLPLITTTAVVANAGWMLAALLLMVYCARAYRMPLWTLLSIPYLMLSLTHWEAIDFLSAAFQMYWGSGLLVIAGMIALAERRPALASLLYLAGMFTSGGAIAAYPVSFLFLLLTRRWRDMTVFLVLSAVIVPFYVHLVPSPPGLTRLPPAISLLLYLFDFVGNLVSTGVYDLSRLSTLHRITGAAMIGAMVWLTLAVKGGYAVKMLFWYVVVVAAMAGIARLDQNPVSVSRYAMYASLAAACVCALIPQVGAAPPASSLRGERVVAALNVISIALWAHSLWACQAPLEQNLAEKRESLRRFFASNGDPSTLLAFDKEGAVAILRKSSQLGLYDIDGMRANVAADPAKR